MIIVFFFFKQKTAYEMRMSDWSSDVCSSDLGQRKPSFTCRTGFLRGSTAIGSRIDPVGACHQRLGHAQRPFIVDVDRRRPVADQQRGDLDLQLARDAREDMVDRPQPKAKAQQVDQAERSEEHTSELQSLMRISYAVFCLTKKQKNQTSTTK